jgi:hypothetical protein
MSVELLPPIEGNGHACLNCAASGVHGAHETMSMSRLLAVGFGDCRVCRDGDCVYEEATVENTKFWTGADAENAAREAPDHDWRVSFIAPLYEAEYQRQGENHWVLVKKGMGFA